MIMPVDNRRCTWCRRLCRYFGEDQYHHCGRCQMWNNRNRCCQIMNTLCSDKSDSELLNIVRCPGLWARILDMTYGSIRELDNHVQEKIWRKFLCGPAPIVDSSSESDPDESFLENIIRVSQWKVPPGCSKLWKFWMLEIGDRSQTLVPHYNDRFRYTRVLYIVIAFLGPFSEFCVAHGSYWNRGNKRAHQGPESMWNPCE